MSMSALQQRFDRAFGGLCAVPHGEDRSALELKLSGEAFMRLLQHWASLEASALPALRGLTVPCAPPHAKLPQLVIDLGGGFPFILLSVDWPGPGAFPSLSGVWPYSAWWEEELRRFECLETIGSAGNGGIAWRQS